jgi:paraquat-inducible protein B
VRSDEPGNTFWLSAPRLGSIGPGTPVFYRDVNVGEVLSYDIGNGVGPVRIHVFVKAPYDRFVHDGTHFWNASGVSVSLGAQGIHLEFESLQALLAGGIAFETPRAMAASPRSPPDQAFKLFDSEADADAVGGANNVPMVAYFDSSVAGLARGSVVEVFGLPVGTVTDVRLTLMPGGAGLHARVAFDVQPERVFGNAPVRVEAPPGQAVAALVREGMRAVLESSNLITGQKAISLQYVPGPAASLGREGNVLVVPSQGGGLDNITASISDIAGKLDKIPFDEIGRDLASTLKSVDRTVSGPDMQNALRQLSETLTDISHLARHADEGLTPALKRLPQLSADLQQAVARANALLGEGGIGSNSDIQRNLARLLDQVNEAARSIRLLADFLDRHPEALIRGRTEGVGEP